MDKVPKEKAWSDKAVDFFFSSDPRKYLVLFVLIGLIIRLIVAHNVAPLADEMIHGTNSINIISSGVINAQNQAPAWLYLTDLAYKIFGVTAIAARFLSIIFGTLTIVVVYLLGRRLFNEKVALIASFLMAISAYYARYTLMEMDHAMMFFILLAFYFFIKELGDKKQLSYLSAIWLGVALLIKPITLPFIASFVVCFFLISFTKANMRQFISSNVKRMIGIILILFLFTTPILAYNYILYEQKGISDVIFSRFLGINQGIYENLQGYNKTFVLGEVFSLGLPAFIKSYWNLDPALFVVGLLGLVLFFVQKHKGGRMFTIFHIIPLIFLLGTSILQTHLSVFVALFTLSGAFAISWIASKIPGKEKTTIFVILSLILLVNLWLLMPHLTTTSAMFQARNYAVANLADSDIIVADSRIYRGRTAWMFNDLAYLESTDFPSLIQLNENLTGPRNPVNVYFVEAVTDDYGWGTIASQPEFNQSMEGLVDVFKANGQEQVTLLGGGGYDEPTGKPTLRIYKAAIDLNPQVYPAIYNTHEWFYYPVRWEKADWYDKYVPEGFAQIMFNMIGKAFLWISILLALLSPWFLYRETAKKS